MRKIDFPVALAVSVCLAFVGEAPSGDLSADAVVADRADTLGIGPDAAVPGTVRMPDGMSLSGAFAVGGAAALSGGAEFLCPLGDVPMGSFTNMPGGAAASPDAPVWWAARGVTGPDAACDFAMAVQCQVKWIALQAAGVLDEALSRRGGAGTSVSNLLASFTSGNNLLPVTLGQLKNTAKPFHDRLMFAGFETNYPWSGVPNDFALATVGQVKYAFSFDPLIDSDGDGIPDMWETNYGLNPFVASDAMSDPDRDGFSCAQEYESGTNPQLADSDGDGLSDAEEVRLGLDPTRMDTDGDGLTDYEELYIYFTDPKEPDTDGDGLSDGQEILVYFTSPFSDDTDDDDVKDAVEVAANMSPLLVDTDGDGIDDYVEKHNSFLNPTDASDAAKDYDKDGFSNVSESRYFWSMTSAATTNATATYRFVSRWPGENHCLIRAGVFSGGALNCVALGDAGASSTLLRVPPTRQLDAHVNKSFYHTGTAGFFLNGTSLSSLSSPFIIPDSGGPVDYRLTALPSAQGTMASVWLGDDQGHTNTVQLNCRVPKITKIDVIARQSANHTNVLFGQTGALYIPWEPVFHEQTHVHVDPTYDHDEFSYGPSLRDQSYAIVHVAGPTNYDANMNFRDYRSARSGRQGLPLGLGVNHLTVGFDFNLDGTLASGEASIACDVYAVRVGLGIRRKNGDIVPEDSKKTTGSVLQLTAPVNAEGNYLGLVAPSVEPAEALNRLTYKFKTWVPDYYGQAAVRIYRNGELFMDASVTTKTVAASDLAADWTLDATRGGILDLSFVAYDPSGREVMRDTVRVNAIPCEPADGRILYVRPDSTLPTPPYASFGTNAAHTIKDAVRAMEPGDNVLVSPYGIDYAEYDIPVAKGGVVAGLGGRWTVANPYTNAGPLAAVFDYSELPTVRPGETNSARAMFQVSGASAAVALSGFRLCSGLATLTPGEGGAVYAGVSANPVNVSYSYFSGNRASDYGGAISLRNQSAALIDTCKFLNNLCEYDDQGTVCYTKGMGGAVASFFSVITITNCVFEENTARVVNGGKVPTSGSSGGGGDIYQQQGDLHLYRVISSGATAGYPIPSKLVPVEIGSSYFTGDGGSILVHGQDVNTVTVIQDGLIETSVAYGNGGACSFSKDSSPEGRQYFVMIGGLYAPAEPEQLAGGCAGLISKCVFRNISGGWQGGAISANGSGIQMRILETVFQQCYGGSIHKRDGKGGAVAVCGGIQRNDLPKNNILVQDSHVLDCSASGNGGGLYVTIRGCLQIVSTVIEQCDALNIGTSSTNDYRMTEGMGGGIHVSAGGYLYVRTEGTGVVRLDGNSADTSGGGLSIKSGKTFLSGSVQINENLASGSSTYGYGNGGGVFITTSYHDDALGVGTGAAFLYKEDGYLYAIGGSVQITSNTCARWGGGVYSGISPPWYGSGVNYDAATVVLDGTLISGNIANAEETGGGYHPSQITSEHVQNGTFATAILSYQNCSLSGNIMNDIGVYAKTSISPVTNNTSFSSLAVTLKEAP